MKYWWLEKYKNFKIIQVNELINDVNYFLTMPKNYEKKYNELKNENIDNLDEEDLLIILYKIINTKNIKNNNLSKIINKLLTIPDNSFPSSDYSLKEMLDEIKDLRLNKPTIEKLEYSNICVCYNCLNIFYVDKIKAINKSNNCLCPFCMKSTLYFDSDYIPMNYSFIKLAYFYYQSSSLGCTFKEIKKIIKKNIKVVNEKYNEKDINLNIHLSDNKIKGIDEKIISKKIYDLLLEKENNMEYEVCIYIDNIKNDYSKKILIVLITSIEILTNSIYLKNIKIKTNNKIIFNELINEIYNS